MGSYAFRKTLVGCQAAIAGKPAPTKDQKIAACGSSYREDKYNPHAAHAAPLQDERKLGCRS